MGETENLFSLVQPQGDHPEILQFFEMLTLPRAIFGYNKEHVIDALRCLDKLYKSRITELEEENRRHRIMGQNQLKHKEAIIASLEKRIGKENGIYGTEADTYGVSSRRQIDVFSQVISQIQQSLNLVIRKAADEARQICADAHRKADTILEESRRKIQEEHKRHTQALEKMAELKKEYLSDLNAMQMILRDMQIQAGHFQKRLESI